MTILTRLRTARSVLGLGRAPRVDRPAGLTEIPEYVAIITDGNGRWARERDLPVVEGHRAGADVVKARLRAAAEPGSRS